MQTIVDMAGLAARPLEQHGDAAGAVIRRGMLAVNAQFAKVLPMIGADNDRRQVVEVDSCSSRAARTLPDMIVHVADAGRSRRSCGAGQHGRPGGRDGAGSGDWAYRRTC